MADDFEERVRRAREANLALYLDDPTPQSAQLMVRFETVVQGLRVEHNRAAAEAASAEAVNRGPGIFLKAATGTSQAQGSDAP